MFHLSPTVSFCQLEVKTSNKFGLLFSAPVALKSGCQGNSQLQNMWNRFIHKLQRDLFTHNLRDKKRYQAKTIFK